MSFETIWPGWYSGRAIHIHVRVRTYDSSGTVVTNYTTQIFFSDADNTAVLTGAAPYNTRTPESDPTTDENDSVLTSSADATNIVPVTGSLADGFAASVHDRAQRCSLERGRRREGRHDGRGLAEVGGGDHGGKRKPDRRPRRACRRDR